MAILRHSPAEVALFGDAEQAQNAYNSVTAAPPGGYSASTPVIYWVWLDLSSGTPQQWYTSGRPRHHGGINFAYADGHAKSSRWDRLTWGNLDAYIPDSSPDYNVPLTTLPSKRWPGM